LTATFSSDASAPVEPTFAQLGVPTPVVAALAADGVIAPFPIQAAAVPAALAGRDVCGKAPTGSGKTIAFGVPLVALVAKAAPRRPTGLVLVPTRELAEQVRRQLEPLARAMGRRVMSVYGGVGFGPQINGLRKGVDIVVACPGRLADLVQGGNMDLGAIDVVVVDEADRMADMGFLPEVKRLLDRTPDTRRTLLFSATLDGEVDVLVNRYQRDPIVVEAAGAGAGAGGDGDEGDVTHEFWAVDGSVRVERAADIIKAHGRTIVFCRTKHGADRVARQLARFGVSAEAMHGDRSQSQRQRALDGFSRGAVIALVATDVAARGIHVDDVACIVQLDPPATAKDYVHRSGRTGRAGNVGAVVSLVAPDKRGDVRELQRELGMEQGTIGPRQLTPLPAGSLPAPRPGQSHDDTMARPRHVGRDGNAARPRGERTARWLEGDGRPDRGGRPAGTRPGATRPRG
jgi:superfamily II DNA/RNA helicase